MIYNEDCIIGAKKYIQDKSVDLCICDPPFGINESSFDKHYKRNSECVLGGYVEAPSDYQQFSTNWLTETKRILKPNGSMYIISGWTNLRQILNSIHILDFNVVNHIIWKFNFGVATKKKFVSSHYHILYVTKQKAVPKFNTYCRFGSQEKDDHGGSLNYQDLQDVFSINKEYNPSEVKNKNKLPDALIEKLILYSSNIGDTICDLFLGNFTTAFVAKSLARNIVGFELNKESFDYWHSKLEDTEIGNRLQTLKIVPNDTPENQGKKIEPEEVQAIIADFNTQNEILKTKKEVTAYLCEKYKRGRFSIKNILDKHLL